MVKTLDPRFESLSGKFNYDLFRKSYKFIESKQEDELKEMKEEMYNEENERQKRSIQVGITHLYHFLVLYDSNHAAKD